MPKSVADRPPTEVTPDPSLEKRTRRTFSAEYKLRLLAEAEACQHGELGEPFCAAKRFTTISLLIGDENLQRMAWRA
ncbi:MAG: hypothetical protein ABI618_14505 [Nitrospirota bacterium]